MAGTVAAAAAMVGGLDWTPASTYDDEGVLVPEDAGEAVALVGEGLSRFENPTPEDVRCIDKENPENREGGLTIWGMQAYLYWMRGVTKSGRRTWGRRDGLGKVKRDFARRKPRTRPTDRPAPRQAGGQLR